MAQVALKRELEAYRDTIDKYNRQARQYTSEAKSYNASVDAYNNSLMKNKDGNPEVVYKRPGPAAVDAGRGGPTLYGSGKVYKDTGEYNKIGTGQYHPQYPKSEIYVLQKKDQPVAKPTEFTLQEPESPGADPASQATAAQMARLNTIGLAEQERGLISNALRY